MTNMEKELYPTLPAVERLALIEMPYLRPSEICRVIDRPRTTIYRVLKDSGIKKHPRLGYLTDDVIDLFQLKGAIKRWKEVTKK